MESFGDGTWYQKSSGLMPMVPTEAGPYCCYPLWGLALEDLDNDGDIDEADRMIWVHDVQNTYYGDSNLDGVFDSKDLVIVFQAGEYEDDLVQNSSWETGDWNGDLDFTSLDLVAAFQDGGFDQGPRAAQSVPEPTGVMLLLSALLMLGHRRRSRR